MAFYSADPIRFGSVSAVTLTLGVNDPELGAVTRHGNEDYVFVMNLSTSDIVPGNGAVMFGAGMEAYYVKVSSVSGADLMVGACKHATLTTGAFGWVVTKGFTRVIMGADNSAAAGGLLALGVNGAFAFKSNSTGYPGNAVGQVISAIASGGSGIAFISVY